MPSTIWNYALHRVAIVSAIWMLGLQRVALSLSIWNYRLQRVAISSLYFLYGLYTVAQRIIFSQSEYNCYFNFKKNYKACFFIAILSLPKRDTIMLPKLPVLLGGFIENS